MENFDSLMMNLDKTDLDGTTTTFSDAEEDTENGRAFTKEELLDSKRKSKIQAENKEMERS